MASTSLNAMISESRYPVQFRRMRSLRLARLAKRWQVAKPSFRLNPPQAAPSSLRVGRYVVGQEWDSLLAGHPDIIY